MGFDKEKSENAIKRAIKGDQDAFSYLYEAYYKHTYMAAKEIISSHEECEDIVQETFMRAFSKLQEGQMIEGFGSYIGTTAKNIAKDHIKAREAKKRPDEVFSTFKFDDKSEDEGEVDLYDNVSEVDEVQKAVLKASKFYQTPEEQLEEKELKEIIDNILSELPDYQQESLSLFYLEGMKYREIAELYGVSVDTVKSRVNQGKKKVEKKILELEKTKGLKLHGLAPIAVFFFILRSGTEVKAAELAPSGVAFVATKMAGAGTKKGIFGAIKSFFSKSVTVAGKTVSTKAIAVVTAGAIGVGGVGVAVNSNTSRSQEDIESELVSQIFEYIENDSYEELYSYLINIEDDSTNPIVDTDRDCNCIWIDGHSDSQHNYRENYRKQNKEYENLRTSHIYLVNEIDDLYHFECYVYSNGKCIKVYDFRMYDHYPSELMTYNRFNYYDFFDTDNNFESHGLYDLSESFVINTQENRYLAVGVFDGTKTIDDSTETESESKLIESDTTDYVEFGGTYENSDGEEVCINQYTGTPGWEVDGVNGEILYILDDGENNVYTLSTSWEEMIDSGYKVVVMSDGSIRVFDEDDEFVSEYIYLGKTYH